MQVNSFSKYAGFTGVRLGWTIVPEGLMYADGSQVKKDYERVMVNGRLLEIYVAVASCSSLPLIMNP